jgi:hypothetical protein
MELNIVTEIGDDNKVGVRGRGIKSPNLDSKKAGSMWTKLPFRLDSGSLPLA